MVGLIVTLEPFHLHQTGRAEQLLVSDELAVTTAWAHDLEGSVGLLAGAEDTGLRLLRELGAPEPWRRHLRQAADGLPDVENPILAAAYERWWSTMPHQLDVLRLQVRRPGRRSAATSTASRLPCRGPSASTVTADLGLSSVAEPRTAHSR